MYDLQSANGVYLHAPDNGQPLRWSQHRKKLNYLHNYHKEDGDIHMSILCGSLGGVAAARA